MRFVADLDRALIVEASRHTHAIWSSGRDLAEHTAHALRTLDAAGPALLRYAGVVDDTGLVASMKRFALELSAPDGGVLPAIGIGAVFTRSDARGRGAASVMLRELLCEARAQGVAAAWLHSEIDRAYYERLGFTALPPWAFRARVVDLPEHGALSIRPAGDGDVERMLAWHDRSFPGSTPWLRPARSPARWRFFAARNRVTAWILADQHGDVGYLAASRADTRPETPTGDKRDPSLWVDEWAAPDVPRERVWATLRALAARESVSEMAGWLRPDHAGPQFAPMERAHSAVPMIALLDPPMGRAAWTDANIAPNRSHFGTFDYF